ncbi:AfsR/SARP family transcriptional regulator [Fodinicola acaciae]|uniref:AfsR/SARP family transcriptional regulator n=1 Tax=Fodinicola acaciae TaxID=2681555 RepID=UPI0013D27368|nr:BTAD domain-containing putative transcriptional regulator [Fodinicola acaciae]
MTGDQGDLAEPVDVLVLGPVGLRRREEFLSPPSGVARAVVAALAIAGSDGLTSSALFETVWGSRAANAERSTVTVSVHRVRQWLREAVGDAVRVDRLGSGYVLRMTGESDVHRFVRLAAGGVEQQAEALALWRGRALADVPADSQDAVAVGDLVRSRLECATAYAGAHLLRGQPEHAIHALNPLVEEHPLDERLQASWMQALAAGGRQAEALEVYERVRRRLRAELGVDPDAVLTDCLLKILRGDIIAAREPCSTSVVPAQLPANVATFTGRGEQLRSLDELPAAASVLVVCGPGGVGKTSLAVRWAYRSLASYPDGQLFVDLRGYSREAPVPVIEVLHRFVRALGCPPDEIPADRDEAAALYRSMLAGRRVLVVLDNALSADQVRPLLPGAGGCTVVVTSRDRLDGLTVRDGAARLDLDVLTIEEARTLLAEATAGQEADLDALARACGCLPLALRVAAAQIRRNPSMTIAEYLREMEEIGPLNALSVEGDEQATVAAAFDLSYARVPADAQRCYRLLALVPGPDVPTAAVAALVDQPTADAHRMLRTLTGVHLVNEHSPDRYSMHDLLKAHARNNCDEVEPAAGRQAAARRLFDWYLATARKATDKVYSMTRLGTADSDELESVPDFGSAEAAASWFRDQTTNIISIVRAAESLGIAGSWFLVDALRGYFVYHRTVAEWGMATRAGLAAAEREASLAGQAAMHLSIGGLALYASHDISTAATEFHRAAAAARAGGWARGGTSSMLSQALIDEITGDLVAGTEKLTAVIRALRPAETWAAEAVARNNLAYTYVNQGRLRQAISQMSWLIRRFRAAGTGPFELLYENRGDAYRRHGNFAAARKDLLAAVEASRTVASRYHESRALSTLAFLYSDARRLELAVHIAEEALKVAGEITDRGLEDYACLALGDAYNTLGRGKESVAAYQKILTERDDVVDLATRVSAMLGVASILREPAVAREVLELLGGRSYRPLEGQAYGLLADLHLEIGQVVEAVSAAEKAVEVYAMTDNRPGKLAVLGTLAQAYRLAGRHIDAAGRDDQAGRLRADLRPLSLPVE